MIFEIKGIHANALSNCNVCFARIVLRKSKLEGPQILVKNPKREAITDSYILNRVTEVACEVNLRRRGPSHLYTKDAPVARRIFHHQCKTTFATQSE